MKSVSILFIGVLVAGAITPHVLGVPLSRHIQRSDGADGEGMGGGYGQRKLLQSVCSSAPLSGVAQAAFTTAAIGQDTPFTMASNTLSVTIQLNVDMEMGSNITISGLTGTHSSDIEAMMLKTSSNVTASWMMSTGSLTLIVGASCLAADSPHVINFTIQNPMATQASVAASISATVTDGSSTQAIAQMAMEVATPFDVRRIRWD